MSLKNSLPQVDQNPMKICLTSKDHFGYDSGKYDL